LVEENGKTVAAAGYWPLASGFGFRRKEALLLTRKF
jgi:hypothetical protein